MLGNFAPGRVWKIFRALLTVFLAARRQERFLGLRLYPPDVLRRTIIEIGASFIKLAQVLATRADFFPTEYIAELRVIHDEAPPMPPAEVEAVFALAFPGGSPFLRFESEPIASASIGQVHRAVLQDGSIVAVKLRRLGVERVTADDMRLLRAFLWVLRPLFSRTTRNSLEAVIAEFSAMIAKETDLSIELDNLRKFRDAYGNLGVRFPEPYPALSSRDALVMSFEEGVRVDDRDTLARWGVPFERVMDALTRFYVEQMLVRGYFHADPHPGNLLVRRDGGLVLLDFGMVKRLPNATRVAMIEVAKAANEHDFELFVTACQRLGVITPAAPPALLGEFAERIFDILGNPDLSASTMQDLAFRTLASMKEFPFKLPQDVVYVLRVSALIEGLGTTYIPNFNGVKDILPLLRKNLVRALSGNENLFKLLTHELVTAPITVRRLRTIVADLSENNLQVKLSPETLDLVGERLRRAARPFAQAGLLLLAAWLTPWLDLPHGRLLAMGLFVLGAARLWLSLR